MQSHYSRILLTAGGLTAIPAIAALRLVNPATSYWFPPCPFHALTGWYCPGCGSLRAIHQLLNGHLLAAFAMNPLAVIALPFLLYGLASELLLEVRGRGLPGVFLPGPWIWTLAVAILAFGIARNLAIAPFPLLAPGARLGVGG